MRERFYDFGMAWEIILRLGRRAELFFHLPARPGHTPLKKDVNEYTKSSRMPDDSLEDKDLRDESQELFCNTGPPRA